LSQPLGVHGGIRVEVYWIWYAAHQEVRVRILAAENGVQDGDVALPGERLEVVRNRHEIRFRR
jgi:hypothetical protein